MTPATGKHDAAALIRLFYEEEKLKYRLREIDASIRAHGNRLSRQKGLIVPLRGPELKKLAEMAA